METLLDRGAEGDLVEAEAAIERLAEATIERLAEADGSFAVREIWPCCGCGPAWRRLAVRGRCLRGLSGIATATWRMRLASKGISDWAQAMP